jgi:hypothetical protein
MAKTHGVVEDHPTSQVDDGVRKIQLEFTKEAMKYLEDTQRKAGLSSKAQVIRNAVRAYGLLFGYLREGYEVHLVKPGEPVRILELV